MTKKSKILIITCTIFSLLLIVGIIVCINTKQTTKTNNLNQNQNTTENTKESESLNDNKEESKYSIILNNSFQIFSRNSGDVEKKYIINDSKYHIVINKNSNKITVNNKNIYYLDDTILSVYIIKDLLAVEVTSNCKNTLVLLELNGNILETIDNIIPNSLTVNEMNIIYSTDNFKSNNNEIYKSHYVDTYSLTYLGDNNFSEITKLENEYKIKLFTPSCSLPNEKYTIYNNNDLVIEVGEVVESKDNHSLIKKKLYINEKEIDIAYNLDNITLLSDNYIFVKTYYQDGYSEFLNIFDFNGNNIVDFNDKIEEGYFVSHPLLNDSNNTYSNETFNIYTVSSEALEKLGRYFEKKDSYPGNYTVGKLWKFNYLGNGQVDNGYIERNITIDDLKNVQE